MTGRDNDTDRGAMVDWETSAHLGAGWHVGHAVQPDGVAWPWVIDAELLRSGMPNQPYGCRNKCCAPHEQPGPLPGDVRSRVAAVRVRVQCQATARTTGQRCRSDVRRGERYCGTHADRAETGRR